MDTQKPADPKMPELLRKNPQRPFEKHDPSKSVEMVPLSEYDRLRNRFQDLQEQNYKLELNRSLRRIGLFLLCILWVYFSWCCEWVNTKFLLIVCFIGLGVISATLGSMWERRRGKGGEEA